MRLEHIPLILGVIVALIGLGFIADASMAAATPVTPERRRRIRAEPSRAGEALVGIGTLCMAAALFGRDTWRYGTVSVLVGSVFLLVGVILNRGFLKEALLFRGPARRSEDGAPPAEGRGQAADIHRRHAPARPLSAEPRSSAADVPSVETRSSTPDAPAARPAGAVRHPTPPLASRAYRPPTPVDATPTPVAGQARFDAPPAAAQSDARPTPPAPPPPEARPAPEASAQRDSRSAPPVDPPPGPQERRKTPRGKR